MSLTEEISRMSKSGCDDKELLAFIHNNYDEIECELNGKEYKEPKKHNHNFCMDCKLEMLIDYQKSTLVCRKCGLCEYYPVYVTPYNHTMQPLRRKCLYKKSDNFEVILTFMVESRLFQMTLCMQLGMKYTMEITYCTATPYQ